MRISNKLIFIVIVTLGGLIVGCSIIHKKDPLKVYGAIKGKVETCFNELPLIEGTVILYKIDPEESEVKLNPTSMIDSSRITQIRTDSLGFFYKDNLISGLYFAVVNGEPGGLPKGTKVDTIVTDSTLHILIPDFMHETHCGKVRINNIQICNDSISIINIGLPIGKGDWGSFDHYYQEIRNWDKLYEIK